MNAQANGKPARRLASFRRLLIHIRELLALDFGFALRDGSTVSDDLPAKALAIVFADEGVIAPWTRRPNADSRSSPALYARLIQTP